MIITCPECATRYQADAAKFPPAGRKVKCAKCGHAWHQDAPRADLPEPVVEPEEPIAPPPPPPPPVVIRTIEDEPRATAFAPDPVYAPAAPVSDAEPADLTRRRSLWPGRLGVLVGWSLLGLIVLVAGWAAIHYRQTVATLWPQTSSFYAVLGMPVNALGIDIVDLTTRREKQDGQVVFALTGRLVNISGRELPVPQLRAALKDGSDRELYHWSFSAGVVTMRPGQSVKFLTRISSPPAGTRGVRVSFTKDGQ